MGGLQCTEGVRFMRKHLITGAVLGVWRRLEDLHGVWVRKLNAEKEPGLREYVSSEGASEEVEPLAVVRFVTNDGVPVVGIQALDEEEAEYLKEHIVPNLAHPELDPLLRAHGTKYYESRGLAGLSGVPSGAKRPKTFR